MFTLWISRRPNPATQVAGALEARGLRVLLDDRPVGAGAKFTDADLIGCPLRLTISHRSLQAGGGELSDRKGVNASVVPLAEIPDRCLRPSCRTYVYSS